MHELLQNYFDITGEIIINDKIDIDGSCVLVKKTNKLPVEFNRVTGDFYCHSNDLITLDGCPEYVGGNFSCNNNQLTSLIGAPKYVAGFFSANANKLTSVEGLSEYIGGDFACFNNDLRTLDDILKHVHGRILCLGNPLDSPEHILAFAREYKTVFEGKYGLEIGEGIYRIVYGNEHIVIKVPKNIIGYYNNITEYRAFRQNPINRAICRLKYINDIPILIMEKLDLISGRFQMPNWARTIDNAQVGKDKKGRFKAYDYA
jgi:hypothetical protein